MTSFLADQNERLRLSTNGSSSRFPGSPHPAVATVAYSPPYSPPDEVFTSCSPSLAPASDPAFPAPLGSPPAAYPIQPACLFSHHDFARILGGAAEPPHPRPPQGPPPYPQNLVSQFLARGPPVRPPSSPQEEQEGQSRTPSCMLNGYLGPHTRPTDRSGPTDGDAGKEIAAITPYQEETKVDLRHRRISQETRGQERGKTADINTDVSTSGAGMPLEQVATDLALPHRNSVRNQDGLHAVQPRREVELNGHSSASDSDNIHSEGPTTNRERLKRSAAAHSYTGSPQCRDRVDLEEVPLPGVESPSLQAHGVRVLSRSPQVGIHSSAEASPAVSSAGQRGEQPSASCRSQPSQLPSELGGMTETRGTRHSQLPGRLARDGYSFPQCNSTDKKEHPDTFPSLLASARHHAFSNPPSPSYREVPASAPPSAVSASAGLTPSTGPTQVGFRFASQEEMRGAAQSLPSGVVSSSRYQPVSGISTVDSGPAVTTTGALATATAFFSDQGTVSRTSPPAIVHPHRATNGIQGSLGSSEGGAAATCNFGEDQSRAFSFGNSGGGAGDGMSSREASVLQNRLEGQQKSAAVPGRMELTGQQRANSIDTGRSFLNGEQRSIRDLLVTRRSTNDAASWLAAQEVAPPQPTAPHHMSPSPARGVQLPSPDMALHRFPINSRTGCYPRSFRLFAWHERQQLLVRSPEELAKCLGCPRQSKAKVVAIFGNTGDGKSVLLNNLFFSGQPVFPLNPPASFAGSPSLSTAACDKTSWPVPVAYSKGPGGQEKGLCPPNFGAALRGPAGVVGESKVDRCSANQGHGTLVAGLGGTKDVWVAWWRAEPYSGCDDAIIMDTEGLLGVCEDEASRLRMLMVVLAVADICIVCKSSERLTVDLFQFLNAASNIYLQHLRPSLREALELQAVPAHPNGPACLIYHQLLYDKPLMTRTTLAAATTSDVCPSSFSHPTARGTAGQSVTASGGRQWDNSGHPGRSAHGLLGTGEDRHRGWLTVMDSSTFLELFNAAFSIQGRRFAEHLRQSFPVHLLPTGCFAAEFDTECLSL
ncbi:zinc finger fyve domain-containing protein 1-like [Cystoisospora suis]|uniref:Zinc finger fyve domain-containing protein 1-like n=1 Tax=Cystoisospora suis TaxID=483139 RepID=A0A2C6LD54_9APIC|nr:zinc finger fyve domain-containing protein 1-like [Cystoisospora suis]